MKVLLDIEESRASFFMEMIDSLDYIHVLKKIKDKKKEKAIEDIIDAFNDVKLHKEGKKSLKTAEGLLDEL